MEFQEEILDHQGLADLLKSGVSTIKKLVSTAPKELPPFVNFGTAKRAVPRWKKSTVLEWFSAREGVTPTRIAPLVVVKTRCEFPVKPATRPRGRPRKIDPYGREREGVGKG